MKSFLWVLAGLVLGLQAHAFGAMTSGQSSLAAAKKNGEVKGYLFLSNHDEIVAQAKKEAKLHVLTSTDQDVLRASAAAFKKKYSFIELRAEEVAGTEVYQRMLQEMKAGIARWDVNYVAFDKTADLSVVTNLTNGTIRP